MRTSRALASAILLTSLIVPSAVAGGTPTTHWVDDDGAAGPNGCNQGTAAFTSIQTAIEGAGRNDTILVCPGTYKEQITIADGQHGLTVRAVRPWVATIRATGAMNDQNLVSIDGVNRVRLQWFRLIAPTRGDCASINDMVRIDRARNFQVRSLRIRDAGPGELSDACGYSDGIQVVNSASGLIAYNLIEDFRSNGIKIDDDAGEVTILRNSIRFFHKTSGPENERQDGIDVAAPGARILYNIIRGLPTAAASTPVMADGIDIADDTEVTVTGQARRTIVRGNRVRYAPDGIDIEGPGSGAPSFLDGMLVEDNVILDERAFEDTPSGIEIDDIRNAVVRGNRATRFSDGIQVADTTSGLRIRNNDFRGNDVVDCIDESTGDGTADTANTWTGNLGTGDPVGICSVP